MVNYAKTKKILVYQTVRNVLYLKLEAVEPPHAVQYYVIAQGAASPNLSKKLIFGVCSLDTYHSKSSRF